jgi:uncharacterized protein (DUF169 family)
MSYDKIAQTLHEELSLEAPPIALAFVEQEPRGMATFDGEVPSACTFWRRAESGTFYVAADKHFNCVVGAMVMGFDLPQSVQSELQGTVAMMLGCGYLAPDEPAALPSVTRKKVGIVYGRLAEFDEAPDLVLMWLTPRQAMLYSEAAGACRWTEGPRASVLGRPACAALPTALDQALPTLSFGCAGMRTFTAVSDDRMLAVVPGDRLQEFAAALEATSVANATMNAHYASHLASNPA